MRFAIALLICCGVSLAQMPDMKGAWVVTVVRFGEPDYTRLKRESKNGHQVGKISGDVQLDGVVKVNAIEFQCSQAAEKSFGPDSQAEVGKN